MQEINARVFHQPHSRPSRIETDDGPADFIPLNQWQAEYGYPVFSSARLLHYHTQPFQQELIKAGVMARIGIKIYLHKTRFWSEYQRIVADNLGGLRHV